MTEVDDTVYGTPCDDVIVVDELGITEVRSGAGNDIVTVGGDVDFVSAGDGNDIVVATEDVDEVFGGEGNDRIYGDSGPASTEEVDLEPSEGPLVQPLASSYANSYPCEAPTGSADTCYMPDDCASPNVCYVPSKPNYYYGGGGNDIIFGQRGNDHIFGEEGNDRLYGGIGDDEEIKGGPGNDLVSGGPGSESLFGDAGDDIVRGDANADTMTGGADTDTLSYATGVTPGFDPGSANYPVLCGLTSPCSGFPTADNGTGAYINLSLIGANSKASNGFVQTGGGVDELGDKFENVIGTPFADYIVGNEGPNRIVGSGGADVILGGDGNDVIEGGLDGNYMDGQGGTYDKIIGGEGDQVDNHCVGPEDPSSAQCYFGLPSVVHRKYGTKISVGMDNQTIGTDTYSMVYVSGYSGEDSLYASINGQNDVLIVSTAPGAVFDVPQAGCVINSAYQVTCDIARLDTIVMAGLGGDDVIDARSSFYGTLSPILLGGDGNDALHGGYKTEDLLVDGGGDDTMYGYDHDDDLISSAGADTVHGGADNDVLVTAAICDGGEIHGDGGEDDVAWAPVPLLHRAASDGVWARLNLDPPLLPVAKAGETGHPGGILESCPDAGEELTSLYTVENLEGTGGRDILVGNSEDNQLLGRAGVDDLYGMGGDDLLQAHALDNDGVLNGGDGDDNLNHDFPVCGDTSRDIDQATSVTPSPRKGIYGGSKPIEEEVIGGDGPKAFFRLGERIDNVACEGKLDPEGRLNPNDGLIVGAPALGKQGALRASIDTSIRLDGSNDMVVLPNKWDPASYATSGYSVEFWVKLDGDQGGQQRYLFSKYDGSTGVYLYRNSAGKFVFGSKTAGGTFEVTTPGVISTSSADSSTGWHHVVGVLNGKTTTLYVDGSATSQTFTPSVFPTAANTASNLIGAYYGSGYLKADVDMLSIYDRPLTPTEVAEHKALTR